MAWTPKARLELNIVSKGEPLTPSRTVDWLSPYEEDWDPLPSVVKFSGNLGNLNEESLESALLATAKASNAS